MMYKYLRKLFVKVNDALGRLSGIKLKKVTYARPSTLKAKEIFGDNEIRVIEIGCASGNNALNVLNTLNISEYIIIDPYDKYLDGYNDYDKDRLTKMRNEANKLLSHYSDKITWIYINSESAINQISGKVDYIYIDGNHSYDYVKSDMEKYSELLQDKYVFGGHDIDLPDVVKAFVEFVSENNYECFEIKDPDWIIYENLTLVNK
jgi:hypothetical protein